MADPPSRAARLVLVVACALIVTQAPLSLSSFPAAAFQTVTEGAVLNATSPGFEVGLEGVQSARTVFWNVSVNASARFGPSALTLDGKMSRPYCATVLGYGGIPGFGEVFGDSVAAIGDVNGDGLADIAATAPLHGGSAYEQRAAVLYGNRGLSWPSGANWSLQSVPGQSFARAVGGGDYTGDGVADLVVTGTSIGNPGNFSVFVFAGGPSGLSTTPTYEVLWAAPGDSAFGITLAAGMDLNGDGWAELVVGESQILSGPSFGLAVIFWGSATGLNSSNTTLLGEANAFRFGWWIASLGDTDADGLGELFVGVPFNSSGQGSSYVYEGVRASRAVERRWFFASPDRSSIGLAAAGGRDLSGDGVPDLAVGGPGNGSSAGSVYIFNGTSNGSYEPEPWLTLGPDTSVGENFGGGVASVDDIDGDGVDDLVVGASGYSDADGRVYVFLMGARAGQRIATLDAETAGDNGNMGFVVIDAGDMDGDGTREWATGAPLMRNGTTRGGAVRVYRGQEHPFPESVSLYVGASRAWNQSGKLVGRTEVAGLEGHLQAYVVANAGSAVGGVVSVPLVFTFAEGGVLNASNLSLTYSVLRPPQGLAATPAPEGGAVIVSWSAQVTDATHIAIWSNKSGPFSVIGRVPAASTQFTDANVSDGARFWYYLVEEDQALGTASLASVTVNALSLDIVPPQVPAGVSAAVNGTAHTATLTWQGNGDDTQQYEIWRRVGLAGEFVFRTRLASPAIRFDDTALIEDQSYAYIVKAIDDAGLSSAFSAPAAVQVPNLFPPDVDFYLPTTWPDNLPIALSAQNVTDTDARWAEGLDGGFNWTAASPALSQPLLRTGRTALVGPLLPGFYDITLRAADASGLENALTRRVEVLDATPPQLAVATGGPYIEGDVVTLDASGSNDTNPGSLITFAWTVTIADLTLAGTGASFTLEDAPSGLLTAIVRVRDSAGNERRGVFGVRVNDRPEVSVQLDASYPPNKPMSVPIDVVDGDADDVITYELVGGKPTMDVSASGLFEWTPAVAEYGVHMVTLRVSDGHSTVDYLMLIHVTRTANAANRPPVFTSVPVTGALPGGGWTYNATATDPDGDLVTLALVAAPTGMAWEQSAKLSLSWTAPNAADDSLFDVELIASDGLAETRQTFSIRVRTANQAPEISTPLIPATVSLTAGKVERIALTLTGVRDPDDSGALSFVASTTDPLNLSVAIERNPQGVLELVITPKVPGTTATVRVTAVDPSGAENSTLATVTINARAVATNAPFPMGLAALALSLAAAGAIVALGGRRRREDAGVGATAAPSRAAGSSAAGPIIAAAPSLPMGSSYLVDSVFLLYKDGRNMFWRARPSAEAEDDPGFLGPMFVAIQDFVREALRKESDVKQLSYGEDAILVERGSFVVLAVTVFGEPPPELRETMAQSIQKLEAAYAGIIESWDGNRSRLPAVEAMLEPIWAPTEAATREEVLLSTRPHEVQVLSGLEFFQGYLRLKVAVVNSSLSVVTGATLDLDYDRDVLHLDRLEPETLAHEGAKVNLGVVHTGEKKTVAFYFDPLICTASAIDGSVRFRDAQGASRISQMKRRQAEVVCPLFFTKEIASTAVLKRLIEAELHQYDVKSYEVAADATQDQMEGLYESMKQAVLAHDIRLVREHLMQEGTVAEAWFYGETKVAGDKFVVRAMLDLGRRRAEFYAASESMSKLTGLLAEMNRTFLTDPTVGNLARPVHDRNARAAYANIASVWAMIERIAG